MPNDILIADYTYDLPDECIARYPVEPRDSSKLLVYRQGQLQHTYFNSLTNFLPTDSFLVFNNTKVIPARLFFQKSTGALIELFLLHPEQPSRIINDAMLQTEWGVWSCLIGNKKRWKAGEILKLRLDGTESTTEVTATLVDSSQNWVELRWNSGVTFAELVRLVGEMPLPPYLNRKTESRDLETYQTVYSQIEGAVAAPTAGLHFTPAVFESLEKRGIAHAFVTLHVGAGTFQPVKVQNVVEHHMHSEQVVYSRELIEQLLTRLNNLIVVGTTSMRSLESLYWYGVKLLNPAADNTFFIEKLSPYGNDSLPSPHAALTAILGYMTAQNLQELVGETEIFIFPGYQFQLCKGLITNYHQPGSTLMLLIAAFVGDAWKRIYEEALSNDYRFLSYGDSSLLIP